MHLFGRRRIYTDAEEINQYNIEKVLNDALVHHEQNAREISYLRWYARGRQPILERQKKTRKDVCNNVVENIAAEIVDFKMGFCFGQPVNTIKAASADKEADITSLIDMFVEQCKADCDQDIGLDFCVAGIGYRGVLPNLRHGELAPFRLVPLNPETTFCVFRNDVYRDKVLGVSYVNRLDNTRRYTAYTSTHRYELEAAGPGGLELVNVSPNGIGEIPIIEYTAPEGFGCFEKAVPLMNAINTLVSNRTDDIAQSVSSILWLHNAEMSKEDLETLEERLAVMTRDTGDGSSVLLKYLENPLDQQTTQALVDDIYGHILEISGVPGRQSAAEATGSSTELGSAGWRKAQHSAERMVSAWKRGERDMFRVILSIFDRKQHIDPKLSALKITDLDTQFLLSKANNLLVKTQGLQNLLGAGIHPRLAYEICDLFADPESVYQESEAGGYIERALAQKNPQPETGDVSNQPQGEDRLTQSAKNKGSVQKPE